MLVQWTCLVVISIFLICGAISVIGLRCYQCTTEEDKDCRDPFHPEDQIPPECPTVCVKTIFEGRVERGCSEDQNIPLAQTRLKSSGCITQYIPMKGRKTICRCSSSRCNGSAGTGSTGRWMFAFIGSLLAAFVNYFYYNCTLY